jgi:hypothetical protein
MLAFAAFGRVTFAATSLDPQFNRIPADFQGRWVSSPDQCDAPKQGWLYVYSLSLDFREGHATVVSVRRLSALEIEVDLTWRGRSNDGEDWRQVRRFTLSRDRHTLMDERDRDKVVRVRCD